MKPASVKQVRCAIYTRVSTDHGLDQEFNSADRPGLGAFVLRPMHPGLADKAVT